MNCRFCKTHLEHVFIDLGNSPPSNSFLNKEQLEEPENFFPLKVYVCHSCYLVQIAEYKKSSDIFNSGYVYFSSYSTTWLQHAKKYTEQMRGRFGLDTNAQVVEVASNDGYLLQYFKEAGVPVLGIEPTKNTAEVAIKKGIDTVTDFFGTILAGKLLGQGIKADLLLGNNVLAHVPDINDFVGGLPILLKEKGVITFEFPHLLQLIDKNQYDTIYHEHFSYLSLIVVKQIFEKQGLQIFDTEVVPTHGGSLRIFAKHATDDSKAILPNVENMLAEEIAYGLQELTLYKSCQQRAEKVKNDFIAFLIEAKKTNKKVAAYGAAAKGNTLLNFAGIKKDLLPFVADASPHKQNKFLPGVHIPVVSEEKINTLKPDYLLILPWNLKEEITKQMAYVRDWGGKFVVAVPQLEIY
jgi:2-polyprenyl-3-methyl-5-hydroxy-6-metoxy-1,4-benzoquinol methylase